MAGTEKTIYASPCVNLSMPPSLSSIALRTFLNTFQRYCRQTDGCAHGRTRENYAAGQDMQQTEQKGNRRWMKRQDTR